MCNAATRRHLNTRGGVERDSRCLENCSRIDLEGYILGYLVGTRVRVCECCGIGGGYGSRVLLSKVLCAVNTPERVVELCLFITPNSEPILWPGAT